MRYALALKMQLPTLLRKANFDFHGTVTMDEYDQLLFQRGRVARHAAIVQVLSGYTLLHHFLACWHITTAINEGNDHLQYNVCMCCTV